MIDDCNLSSVVVRDNPESCIFCLEGEPQPTLYEGACKCHPLIHNSCISEWHKINPNSCPILLKRGKHKFKFNNCCRTISYKKCGAFVLFYILF